MAPEDLMLKRLALTQGLAPVPAIRLRVSVRLPRRDSKNSFPIGTMMEKVTGKVMETTKILSTSFSWIQISPETRPAMPWR